jgi:LPS-assembly protein
MIHPRALLPSVVVLGCILAAPLAEPAAAQVLPGFTLSRQWTLERLAENHWKLTGAVEVERDAMKFYADEIEVFTDTNRLTGKGNVVYLSGDSRIAADSMEFNTKTRLGTFYNASGSASLGELEDRSMFGTQEPDAYFYGQVLEKIGPKRYRITQGGFTTCLQPTPRWELVSTTVVINLDDYAVLRNPVLKVKGVPVFYLPILYYPIQDDERATGFLLPTYGASTFRGQTLSNAFFWAMDRSQDATFYHDWYTRTGQGMGVEYRYISGPGSQGSAKWYLLSENATTFDDGVTVTSVPERKSYEIRANAGQALPRRMRVRGYVDYFSDVTTQQLYQQNIYDSSQRSRSYGANLQSAWSRFTLTGSADVREIFYGDTDSSLYGSAPRVLFLMAPRSLGESPVYVSFGSEYARLLREDRTALLTIPQGLTRLDFSPSVQLPLTRWPFLSIRSAATWHGTYYTDSLVDNLRVTDPYFRSYFDLKSEVVGPSFVRIWDTPTNGYAEKFKHVIEPFATVQRLSPIENERIVQLEGYDYTVGDMTRLQYGLTNRFLARRTEEGRPVAREFVTVALHQTYYTNPQGSLVDYGYTTSFRGGREPSNFSPVSLAAKVQVSAQIDGSFRLEYDPVEGGIQSMAAAGAVGSGERVLTNFGWSQRRFRDTRELDNYFNADVTLRSTLNRIGGTYGFNYDLARRNLFQQRMLFYYNAQCCGIALEYQAYNYPKDLSFRFPVAQDRRFNVSFTLAGLGTFSNPFGSFSGAPGRY